MGTHIVKSLNASEQRVKDLEGLLDGLAWDDNVDHHDKDCQCDIHKARRFLEMLDTERGKPE